jgi:hypothetical protein
LVCLIRSIYWTKNSQYWHQPEGVGVVVMKGCYCEGSSSTGWRTGGTCVGDRRRKHVMLESRCTRSTYRRYVLQTGLSVDEDSSNLCTSISNFNLIIFLVVFLAPSFHLLFVGFCVVLVPVPCSLSSPFTTRSKQFIRPRRLTTTRLNTTTKTTGKYPFFTTYDWKFVLLTILRQRRLPTACSCSFKTETIPDNRFSFT